MAAIGIGTLGETGGIEIGGIAGGDGDVTASCFPQHAVQKPGALCRVAEIGGDAQDVELRTAQRQRHREGVVDVIADVSVDDDFLRGARGRLRPGGTRQKNRSRNAERNNPDRHFPTPS